MTAWKATAQNRTGAIDVERGLMARISQKRFDQKTGSVSAYFDARAGFSRTVLDES